GNERLRCERVRANTPAFLPPIRKSAVENKDGHLRLLTHGSGRVPEKADDGGLAGFVVPVSGGSTPRPPEGGTPDAISKAPLTAAVVATGARTANPCDDSKSVSRTVPASITPAKP